MSYKTLIQEEVFRTGRVSEMEMNADTDADMDTETEEGGTPARDVMTPFEDCFEPTCLLMSISRKCHTFKDLKLIWSLQASTSLNHFSLLS